jgi:hypothetical protein
LVFIGYREFLRQTLSSLLTLKSELAVLCCEVLILRRFYIFFL